MAEPLLIMRHGEAAPGSPDAARELTVRGQEEAAGMGAWLAGRTDLDLARLRLVASPYRRAQQTAERVGEALGVPVETLPCITPDDPPQTVVDWLLEQDDDRPLMLVSHMPLVGALTGLLVEGRGDRGLGFPTAAVAELDAEVRAAGCARLARFTSPADIA
ncbi:phosphohistidine phosphatase SixA [Halomonas sp. ND22Bw]|uniref:Phosphohistidine phosphatase n=1 Tax=Halomonas salina TaxID=42565 RepID=A0ABR4WWS2_9GAMM|nr:phosphohistidine phosphatase SixA [Halomonas salina]KGE79183.1 phosphohistidine phosphatase [Halomonas salina]PSJ23247.1 phosphohistidine phosphatase SixA [Halomonas sp. ND22Bw]